MEAKTIKNVNLRPEASHSSTSDVAIPADTDIQFISTDKTGTWSKIEYKGQEGFVLKKTIRTSDEKPDDSRDQALSQKPLALISEPEQNIESVQNVEVPSSSDVSNTSLDTSDDSEETDKSETLSVSPLSSIKKKSKPVSPNSDK